MSEYQPPRIASTYERMPPGNQQPSAHYRRALADALAAVRERSLLPWDGAHLLMHYNFSHNEPLELGGFHRRLRAMNADEVLGTYLCLEARLTEMAAQPQLDEREFVETCAQAYMAYDLYRHPPRRAAAGQGR